MGSRSGGSNSCVVPGVGGTCAFDDLTAMKADKTICCDETTKKVMSVTEDLKKGGPGWCLDEQEGKCGKMTDAERKKIKAGSCCDKETELIIGGNKDKTSYCRDDDKFCMYSAPGKATTKAQCNNACTDGRDPNCRKFKCKWVGDDEGKGSTSNN